MPEETMIDELLAAARISWKVRRCFTPAFRDMMARATDGESLTTARRDWIRRVHDDVIVRRKFVVRRSSKTRAPSVPADDAQAKTLAAAGFANFVQLAVAAGTRPQTLDAVRRGSRGLTDSLLRGLSGALRASPEQVVALLGDRVKRRVRRPSEEPTARGRSG